ncbi:RICIN domain-containing protein [Streptomyces sp. NRRL WC-3742]|uniref:RICIN domain-containing protein n=1 Tax=Streptomyces sp. NRRL WC-3742 TaxID=1463934 RepID=UPI0004C6F485|nr:ricin-type beta-trefoil lectin domain protein [Streptomyces sp. NRRL WC-3742]
MAIRKRIAALAAASVPLLGLVVATPAHADGYTEIRFAGGLCLDAQGGNWDPGTIVQLWGCNGTMAQQWSIESVDSTHFQIVYTHFSPDRQALCVNNWEGGDTTGNHLKLYYCNSSNPGDVQWNKTYYGGHIQLQPKVASKNCLNGWGGLNQGAEARLFNCGDYANENVTSPSGAF